MLSLARKSPILKNVTSRACRRARAGGTRHRPREGRALGVSFEDINDTIQVNLGSVYTNDFPNRGKMQRVIVQSEQLQRLNAADLLNYGVKNAQGTMVPMSSFADLKWSVGPAQIIGFNGYQSVRITGEPAAGYTTPATPSPRWSG